MSDDTKVLEDGLDRVGEAWAGDSDGGDDFVRRFRKRLATETKAAPQVVRRARPLRWMALAAAILVIAGISTLLIPGSKPVGLLRFTTGTVTAPQELGPGALVVTANSAAAIANLDGERVALHLNADSTLRVGASDSVTLESGELWTVIVPNSGHFEVNTPQARVVAKGTTFGVKVTAEGTLVVLQSGRIDVQTASATVALEPGGSALVRSGVPQPNVSTVGTAAGEPEWVRALVGSFSAARSARRYPSGMPVGAPR